MSEADSSEATVERINLEEALRSGCILLNLKSNTKQGIITEMVDRLWRARKIRDRKAALQAVLDREAKMSTGMHQGVAIPHGKTPTVGRLATAIALKKEGVDFNSLDGQPSRIFVMTVSSTNQTGPHMQYLSEISKVLSCPAVRERLMDAATEEDVIRALTE